MKGRQTNEKYEQSMKMEGTSKPRNNDILLIQLLLIRTLRLY